MDQSPFVRPVSTATGTDRLSQAPQFGDDLHPPTALATPFGGSNPSVADSSRPLNNNLPYRESLAPTAAGSAQHLGDSDKEAASTHAAAARETSPFPDLGPEPDQDLSKNRRKRLFLVLGGIAALAIIAIAVAVPVAITQSKKSSHSSASSSPNSGPSGSNPGSNNPPSSNPNAITGGNGTIITTETGATFMYINNFGGSWYDDPEDPYNNNAQAQSWTKPLSQDWDWSNDVIRGVNLGGWLVPEPFIVPALFEPYVNAGAKDEWSLCLAMAADTANGGLSQLETHYATFITEEDFAQIAGAGLSWVRLPVPFWAIEKYPAEPFLEKVAWTYILKAFKWARKYGLRINLDLHAVPGSQNGYNHSGKSGQINFLYGPMGIANAQRTLDYIRIFTEFISQPEYAPVVPMFGIINEPVVGSIGMASITSFYLAAHDIIRNITGIGTGKGAYISVHDGFQGLAQWADLLPGHDRMALDVHPYLIFSSVNRAPLASQINAPCTNWAADMNTSWTAFGVSAAGEFSLAVNDCGLWVNGVGAGTRWEGTFGEGDGVAGDCTPWNDYTTWTQDTKDDFNAFALRNFDALGHWFFWTWKIGASSVTGKIESPMWSYSLGLQEGWMPTDPTKSTGVCGNTSPAAALTSEMTGGPGAGEITNAVRAASPWPPTRIQPLAGNNLPLYTPTGPIPTLPMPTPSATVTATSTADGWFDAADTRPIYTPISGCTYPNAWGSADAANPGPCGGAAPPAAADDDTDATVVTTTAATRARSRVAASAAAAKRTSSP